MLFETNVSATRTNLFNLQALADAKKSSASKFDDKEDPSAGLMNVSTRVSAGSKYIKEFQENLRYIIFAVIPSLPGGGGILRSLGLGNMIRARKFVIIVLVLFASTLKFILFGKEGGGGGLMWGEVLRIWTNFDLIRIRLRVLDPDPIKSRPDP